MSAAPSAKVEIDKAFFEDDFKVIASSRWTGVCVVLSSPDVHCCPSPHRGADFVSHPPLQAFELDNGWLDRLDMGFDFTDILAQENSDGMVPSLSPTASKAFSGPFAVPQLPVEFPLPSADELVVPSPHDFDDFSSLPLPSSPLAVPDMLAPVVPELPCLHSGAPHTVPTDVLFAAPKHVVPPPPAPSAPMLDMGAPMTRAAAAAAAAGCCRMVLSFPNSDDLTREQRVARYREKRKNRSFQKTIRYASRKAYAEVRPRIKGRFAKKEELEAWRAAETAMAGGPVAALERCVPVM